MSSQGWGINKIMKCIPLLNCVIYFQLGFVILWQVISMRYADGVTTEDQKYDSMLNDCWCVVWLSKKYKSFKIFSMKTPWKLTTIFSLEKHE